MIEEYHRPQTLEDALKLISRSKPRTYPLGGGTVLSQFSSERYAVVDLQGLGLDRIRRTGDKLRIGATTTLNSLAEYKTLQPGLRRAIRMEANYNLRQIATAAGALVACDGRSSFATTMLALDAKVILAPGNDVLLLGDLLPIRNERLRNKLIVEIEIDSKAKVAYEYVARTPADLPIVCAAVAKWPSGRVRVALGGYGETPLLALDGNDDTGVQPAVQNALVDSTDNIATAEYRMETAVVLANRCLENFEINNEGSSITP